MRIINFLIVSVSFLCLSVSCNTARADNTTTLRNAEKAFAACKALHGVNVVADGKVVCLRGKIDPSMYISLLRVRDEIRQKPYVVISGPGGYVDSSVYIVRTLEKYDPVTVVGDMCASACAQFLFLMGQQRVLLHCANVAIHGGPATVEDILASNHDDAFMQRLIANISQFKEFYYDRKISLDMVSKPPLHIQKKINAGELVFWPWSINQLRSFGVKGIISENDPDAIVPADYAHVCLPHDNEVHAGR